MKFFNVFTITSALAFVPILLLAQIGEDGTLAAGQGLVPCSGTSCSACHVVVLANTIIRWLMGVVAVLFAVAAAVAGWGLVTSQGNPGALEDAKKRFVNVFIGLIIVLGAWLLVDTIMLGLTGQEAGSWSEVECGSQTDSGERVTNSIEIVEVEDEPVAVFVLPSAGGVCPAGFSMDSFGSCLPLPSTVSPDAGGNCPVGYTFDAFGDCKINLSAAINGVTVNDGMNPIFDPSQGGSSLVRSGAGANMQQTLAGPYARLQSNFGRPVIINDAIAKAGTSRETQTKGSRHFHGDALDLSTAGMSNQDKIRLFHEAKRAGFTGFGFGKNILHVDTGPKRSWSYGNSTYGGVNVSQLKAEANR